MCESPPLVRPVPVEPVPPDPPAPTVIEIAAASNVIFVPPGKEVL